MIFLSGRFNGSKTKRFTVHRSKALEKYGIRRLTSYKKNEIALRLQNYKKFMFARNPFERLLSGYKNKFLGKEWYFINTFGKKIKRMIRKTQKGGRVTLDEFLRWLVKLGKKRGSYFDEHWRHYNSLCHPCDIEYDFIGKMETINEDSEFIMRNLYNKTCPLTVMERPGGHQTTDAVTSSHYSNITQEVIQGIYNLYEKDFHLFGYDSRPPGL